MPSSRSGAGATLCGEKGAGVWALPSARRPEGQAELEIKRMKLMDLEFANDVMTAEGQAVNKAALKRWRAEAAAEKAEAFRKGRL